MKALSMFKRCWLVIIAILLSTAMILPANAEVADKQRHSVAYISTRNLTGDLKPANFFGDERSEPRYGYCEFDWIPSDLLKGLKQKAPFYIAEGTASFTDLRQFSEQGFWNDFRDQWEGEKPVLYVHGYNIGFEKGCSRARIFQENIGLQRRLILFSWPSDGSTLNYTRDEVDVSWAVRHLENTLLKMAELFGDEGFDVVGHSLGGRGVSMALSLLSGTEGQRDKPMIDRLILSAADIDAEVFVQRQEDIRSMANHATLYASNRDYALTLSREVHGYPRLGEAGEHLKAIRGFEVIDVSAIPVKRISGHLYHLANDSVIRDFDQLLNQRLPAEKRVNLKQQPGMGEQHWKIIK